MAESMEGEAKVFAWPTTSKGDIADVRGSQGNDGELMEPSNTADTEDLDGATVTSV